ncbi:probable disease resistance protein At1g61300 [Chenopodium quinoa]|uniref:probable disease resistance protein At1g61300 n=1 Tax=Chenopodium quinoa TaxID=63459 RepID=UPI000B779AC6|nr:probable disease resistance protein At1g61300 [Chenopodium quinoa]
MIMSKGLLQLPASSSQPICHSNWLFSNDSSTCHKKWALKFKTNKLFARAQDVCKEVEHDEIQPKKMRRMEVQHWLTAVDQIREEVENIATDDLSIENFTSQVDELLQRGSFPNGYVLPDDSPIEFPLSSKNPAGEMFALNTATILEWLKNNERCIIGVYGMGGVGKTTMLRWIYNKVLKQKHVFGCPYWVTVSQNCDELKLQNEIAKELGVDLSGEGDDRKRAALLHRQLSTMGPTVLFLDDMWKWNPFLGKDFDFPIEGSSCKIIVSSRSRNVCKEMGCKGFVIETKVLPEGEAWNLFVEKLGHYDKLTEEAKEIARLIAKECGGLPLAIATMARSMTDVVDAFVWNDALTELRQSSCEQSDMEEYVFSVLKYSYNRLNDQRLQNCFLSCILYPEDKTIVRKTLIEDWIMEGLLDDVGSRSEQLNKGHTILNKLINSCLLEACTDEDMFIEACTDEDMFIKAFTDKVMFFEACTDYGGNEGVEACTDYGGNEGVKMHDLMRDLGIMITKGYPCFMTKLGLRLREVPEEEQWSEGLVKVSLSHNKIEEIPNGMAPLTPELTVLLLNNNPLCRIPESFFMHMRALTILNLSYTSIVRLPESVSDLANLRALLLVKCRELTYVPSLTKLSNLRVLDLDNVYKLEKAPDGIENLKCLEKVSYWPWDISDSTGFNKLIQSLPSSLSCYRFWLHNPKLFKTWFCYDIFDRGYENEVWVAGAVIEDDETSYMLPATIEMLEIYKCDVNRRNLGDVFPTLGLATDLNLAINWCPNIKVIFPLSDKQFSLPYLKHLSVDNCDELEEIFESNKNNHHNSGLALPNLVSVRLDFLQKLQGVYMTPHLCTSLEELSVRHCEELEEIFESDGRSVQHLQLYRVGQRLVVDPMNACYPQHNPISVLPKLKILNLKNLPKLGSIYKDLHLCTSLEELCVWDCNELKEIFESGGSNSSSCNSPPRPNSALSKLRIISLKNLPKLESIYKDLHLCTSLEELTVINCPKIERIFEAPQPILALPNLRVLILNSLRNLSRIHRGLLRCPFPDAFSIEGCFKLKKVPLSDHLKCDDSYLD